MAHRRTRLAAMAWLLLAISACQPSSQPGTPLSGANPAPTRGPKVLSIAIQREPPDFGFGSFTGSRAAGGGSNAGHIPHDALAVERDTGEIQPQLAVDLPSVDRGTWRVNADGTMETTWTIRPNVRWHDGTPFTSDDLMFSFEVFKDPLTPTGGGDASTRVLMSSATAPDPQTFILSWSGRYYRADLAQPGTIKPKHLVSQAWESDRDSFLNHPVFTHEFVGLGPYRLVHWERGAHMEFARFDDYYRGRPPFDRVVLRFLGDSNTMVANILSGDVDVVLPIGVSLESALEIEQRWAGTGNEVRTDFSGRMHKLSVPHRPDTTRPLQFGFTNRDVREALYRAIDRQAVTEVATLGRGPVADSWIGPNDALYPELQASIPLFPYDPRRAEAMLAQVGWSRGPDGFLVHEQTGERFTTPLGATRESTREQELTIVADGWKAIGVDATITLVPPNLTSGEFTSKHPGPYVVIPNARTLYEGFLHSRQITSEANRWNGQNRQGYHNPKVDALLDALQQTIDRRDRLRLHRELLQEQMGDIALMPIYWEVVPVLTLKGVKTNRTVGTATTPAFVEWDRD